MDLATIIILIVGVFSLYVLASKSAKIQLALQLENLALSCGQGLAISPQDSIRWQIILLTSVSLFAELAVIRLQSSYLTLFSLLKNASLLACFLGLGIGYGIRARNRNLLFCFMPLYAIQIILLMWLNESGIATRLGNPFKEELGLGLLAMSNVPAQIFAFAIILIIFALTAFTFVPLGHAIGMMMQRSNAFEAYSWNLIGSILGVIVFWLLSSLWLGPSVWTAMIGLAMLPAFGHVAKPMILHFSGLLLALVVLGLPEAPGQTKFYSPYQTLRLEQPASGLPTVNTDGIYYQKILDLSDRAVNQLDSLKPSRAHYDLPFRAASALGHVLIVGSGAGNDVAAAVRNKAKDVTAVEIDPIIFEIGRRLHPEQPYQAASVHTIVSDARRFFRHTHAAYDLIIYGLLDSHALLSSRSGGIRLDSYVYTVEAFTQAKNLLAPGGLLALSFVYLSDEFAKKLFVMLTQAFDAQTPLVLRSQYDGSITFFAGNTRAVNDQIRSMYIDDITQSVRAQEARVTPSSDDWPFLYMVRKAFPKSYMLLLVPIFLVSYLLVSRMLGSACSPAGIDWEAFFLGTGFMLLETKAITETALLFGSVFTVNSIVILAMLILAFLANRLAPHIRKVPRWLPFLLLFGSIVLSAAGFGEFSQLSPVVEMAVRPVVLALPIFFSGLCFSRKLTQDSLTQVLSANLLGAIFGGVLEYSAMRFGFNALYILIAVVYLTAMITHPAPAAAAGLKQ